ncbi:proline-rich protein 2-like [Scylla paramamosain]|uniref:proline-rich protein 2-like n=1 Tax=Scylla paramamosain TaxID=85552 RepID=UPI003082B2DE
MVASQEARRHKALARSFSSIPSATAGSESEGPDGQAPPGVAEPRRCTPAPAPAPAPDPDPSSMVMGGLTLPHPPRSPPLDASQPHNGALRQSPRGRAARGPPLIQRAVGTLRDGGTGRGRAGRGNGRGVRQQRCRDGGNSCGEGGRRRPLKGYPPGACLHLSSGPPPPRPSQAHLPPTYPPHPTLAKVRGQACQKGDGGPEERHS